MKTLLKTALISVVAIVSVGFNARSTLAQNLFAGIDDPSNWTNPSGYDINNLFVDDPFSGGQALSWLNLIDSPNDVDFGITLDPGQYTVSFDILAPEGSLPSALLNTYFQNNFGDPTDADYDFDSLATGAWETVSFDLSLSQERNASIKGYLNDLQYFPAFHIFKNNLNLLSLDPTYTGVADLLLGNFAIESDIEVEPSPNIPLPQSGKIVVANDEHTLGDIGFLHSSDTGKFALNVAEWFVGNDFGKFHAYSTNFGLNGVQLAQTMQNYGHEWTTGLNISFDLETLLNYDAVFVGGNFADNQVLIDYVSAGGNVYLMAGTGVLGNAVQEATVWNPFLNHFGLEYAPTWNGVRGTIPIESSHPLFSGVDLLYQNNGNDALVLDKNDPNTKVLVNADRGLYAVYDPSDRASVPEPTTTIALFGFGTIALKLLRKRN